MLERRRHSRVLTATPARILVNWSRILECTVSYLFVGGACLELSDVHVPDLFDLIMDAEDEVQACRVA
jgi:hypothetical protein